MHLYLEIVYAVRQIYQLAGEWCDTHSCKFYPCTGWHMLCYIIKPLHL